MVFGGNGGRRAWLALVGVVVVALALAGCSKGQAASESSSLPVVKVSVQKFKYQGVPATLKAGEMIITFSNRESGAITHEMILLALPSGKTAQDISNDAKASAKGADAEGDFLSFGEIADVDTGGTHAQVFSLPAGTYALACFEDGKLGGGKGPVHASIGMVQQFTVS
jgi:uncharacterized cupredoxin-like copper-binding protein